MSATEANRASRGLTKLTDGLTDRQLALVVSGALFLLCAWPVALTDVPPFQDLPNHLAAVTVIENPTLYPELVFNGFFKTNAALFTWLLVVGKITGHLVAARLFALLVLGANAYMIPRFVLALTGSRRRMVIAGLFAWPMIHNWFVSTGMLDFALAIPLSLAMLVALERQWKTPTLASGLAIVGLGALTWYAHAFPLLVVDLLVLIEAAARRSRKEPVQARAILLPLLPVTALVVYSVFRQLSDAGAPMSPEHNRMLAAWELAYNLWAEWLWGFTKLSISSFVPCVMLAWLGWARRKESIPFFSPVAVGVLIVLYCFAPYVATNWFHVNSRLIPFIWFGLLLRVPETLSKKVVGLLVVCALLYSAGMGVDYVRLDRERQEFTAGIPAVPERARLLPILFRQKGTSENTLNLLHAWGYYVTEKHTAAPLVFAHSSSFAVMYRTPPPVRSNRIALEGFATSTRDPLGLCLRLLMGNVVVNDCNEAFRLAWHEFWAEVTPLYDHILLWDPTPEAVALIPPVYTRTFEQGRLSIYARSTAP